MLVTLQFFVLSYSGFFKLGVEDFSINYSLIMYND